MTEPQTLYSLSDLAAVFGVGSSAVSNWLKRGSGPDLPEPLFRTSAGRPLFTAEQVETLIAERTAAMQAVIRP